MQSSDVRLERLAEAIRMLFKSQREFAEAVGVHESTVSKWLQGERPVPEHILSKLLELGVSPNFLAANASKGLEADTDFAERRSTFWLSGTNAEASSDAKVLAASHRKRPTRLSPEIDRISVDQPTNQDVIIPMLESSIPAGDRVPIYEDLATQFNVTVYYRNCFTMRVKGDSMIDAGICDGDRVVIKRGHRFRDGDVIAAVVDGEMTLKGVWKRDGKIFLVPANSKYRVVEIAEESDFQCLGVCIDTFRPPTRVEWRE